MADGAFHNFMRMQQFDGTNFSNWKFRVKILLDEKDLEKYIDEKLEDILPSVSAENREAIRKEEKLARSILIQSIHDSQLELVKEKVRAKDIWDTLCNTFERKSIASQLLLRKQLLMMKYDDNEDIAAHFLVFDRKIRELKSAGVKMEELDIIVHLLLTMPNSYEHLVTAIETIRQDQLTMEFVRARLIDEYNKRTGGIGLHKSSESGAMFSKGKTKEIVCYRCKKPGHRKAQCFLNKKDKKEKRSSESANNAVGGNMSTMCAITNDMSAKCQAQMTRSDSSQIKFVLDSGATQHMVNDRRYFDKLRTIDEIQIGVAKKNQSISANQQGDIVVKIFCDDNASTKTMENVLLVNDLKCNLMSIRSLTNKGYNIVFKGDQAYVSLDGKTQFMARANGKLYEVDFHVDSNVFAGLSGEKNMFRVSQTLWHFRLGHLNANDMKKLIKLSDGLSVNMDEESKMCESCVFGKQTRSAFPKNKNARSKRILELIHSDVCGPIPTTAYDGSKYFVTFTDDYSRASIVFCIQKKSEVLAKFKEFVAMAEALHGKRVAKLRADNGGEYVSKEFKSFCQQKGIQMSFTVPYNPEMNSVSERLNRTLQEKARTILLASNVDHKFWNEAIITANYIKNRSPTSAVGKQFEEKTPAEIWFGQKPNLAHLRIFGAECYNHIPSNNRSKLQAKSTKCLMLGYTGSIGSYRLWDIEQQKLIVGRNVTFNETSVLNQSKLIEIIGSEAATNQEVKSEEMCSEDADESRNETFNDANDTSFNHRDNDSDSNIDQQTPRRGERNRRKPERYGDWDTDDEDVHLALSAEQYVDDDPLTIAEANNRSDWPEWKKAIDGEYHSLIKSNTFTVCELPENRRAISNKWVFKLKRKADGSIDKYKARLVARGFSQKLGFDYNETYAPVAKLVTLKILLAIANHHDMQIHQMDVKSAFLNGELSEEIYMELPDGFREDNKVCKLNKALYGLKQASRAWNEKFNEFMTRIGFKRCDSDQCLYVKQQDGFSCYVLLYVDDALIFCININVINIVKRMLSTEFEMTDMGKAGSFLGMQIDQDIKNGIITLSQSKYLEKVLQKFGMQECKPKSTPMQKGLHLDQGEKGKCSNHPYRELIGCLTYATVTTRPDLCSATGYFSRFQSCFDETHFNHAKHILRYIRGTIDMKLIYKKQADAETLIGYSDSDWAGDKNDSKSTSGYVFKLYGNTVSWASRKQPTVSKSSTEAEYIALAEAISEAEWIKKLLVEVKIDFSEPIPIFEDNTSCIKIAEEPREYKRMKHLDVKYNFIRDYVAKGKYEIVYVSTQNQVADIMTKGLGKILFIKHRSNLNLI